MIEFEEKDFLRQCDAMLPADPLMFEHVAGVFKQVCNPLMLSLSLEY